MSLIAPNRRVRLVIMLVVAGLAAGLLSTGNALLAPTPAAAWPAGCDHKQKAAFIAFPSSFDGLEAMEAPLRELRELWPVKRLWFRYIDAPMDFSPAGIDAMVDEVEARVNYLESRGFNRIGLPTFSSFLNPFIHGTAGSLGGVPLQTRHPDSVFVTLQNGTDATEDPTEAGNVFRVYDVPTSTDSLPVAVDALTGSGGEMLILYQDGDVVSESVRDDYLAIAGDLGITAASQAIGYDGFSFDPTDLAAALLQLDALPANSLVVHIVNGALSDQYAADADAAGIFTDQSNSGPVKHFGGNFFPSSYSIPVQLELGYQEFQRPSWQSTRAGFSNRYTEWFADARSKLYMEAFGFLAKCGKFHGIMDGFQRFDAGGTRIAKQLERIYIPADSLAIGFGERVDNERWYDDQVAWDWNAVFGE